MMGNVFGRESTIEENRVEYKQQTALVRLPFGQAPQAFCEIHIQVPSSRAVHHLDAVSAISFPGTKTFGACPDWWLFRIFNQRQQVNVL